MSATTDAIRQTEADLDRITDDLTNAMRYAETAKFARDYGVEERKALDRISALEQERDAGNAKRHDLMEQAKAEAAAAVSKGA